MCLKNAGQLQQIPAPRRARPSKKSRMRLVVPTLIFAALVNPIAVDAQTSRGRAPQAADLQAAQACVGDLSAPITFYGSVPSADLVATESSFVQIFPASDTTSAYLQLLENNVNGVMPSMPEGAADDPNYLSEVEAQAQAFVAMPQIARRAPILHTGQFICRGLTPGKYEFFATVYALGKTSRGGSGKSFVTLYYRATVTTPETHKSKLLVGVPSFRLVGQTPK